jgi:hypothetical protein
MYFLIQPDMGISAHSQCKMVQKAPTRNSTNLLIYSINRYIYSATSFLMSLAQFRNDGDIPDSCTSKAESIEWIYRGKGFLVLVCFGSLPLTPLSPVTRQQVVSLSQSSCVPPVELTDGRGCGRVGEESNHIARMPGPLCNIYSKGTQAWDNFEFFFG